MKRHNIFYIITFISTILAGCFGFDKYNGDNIIGNYYVKDIADFKTSLNYKVDTTEVDFSKVIVNSYVYEVLWNEKFILIKQHPEYLAKNEAYDQISLKFMREMVKNTI